MMIQKEMNSWPDIEESLEIYRKEHRKCTFVLFGIYEKREIETIQGLSTPFDSI